MDKQEIVNLYIEASEEVKQQIEELLNHGLHDWQGLYPSSINSVLVVVRSTLFDSFILDTEEQDGL